MEKVQQPMKNNQKPMKNQRKPVKKTPGNQKTKEKTRGNNTNARKSINTVAKPMNMWKNDGEHPPTKKKQINSARM